jgi:hypothetical protein
MLSFIVQYFDVSFYIPFFFCQQISSFFLSDYYMIQMIIYRKCNGSNSRGGASDKIRLNFLFFRYFRQYVLILMYWCNVWRNNNRVHLCRNDIKGKTSSFFFILMNNLIQRCANLLCLFSSVYIYYVNNQNKEVKYS